MNPFQAVSPLWAQPETRVAELELFPRPGLVWAPTLRRGDPRSIQLDSDDA